MTQERPHPQTDDAVDWAVLESLAQVFSRSPDAFQGILNTYFEGADEALSVLRRAIEQGDHEAAETEAHKLKGTSAQLGFRLMSTHAERLEDAATRHDLPLQRELLDDLSRAIDVVRAKLSVLRGSLSTP